MEMEKEVYEKKLQEAFDCGMAAGVKAMMDKIERHCKVGKPVLCNGNLYWLKDANQNLRDIMDDINSEFEGRVGK